MRLLYIFFCLFLLTLSTSGATKTATTGDWNTAGTWSPSGVPVGSDNIIVPSGVTLTLSTDWVVFFNPGVNTLTIDGTLVLNNAGISLNSYDILTVNTGGQIIASGVGAFISSGVTGFFSTLTPGLFPMIGPLVINNGALPITLLFFRGQPMENRVILSWASETELNFDYYRIEHSSDGHKFEMLDRVKGSAHSDQKKYYKYTDNSPAPGKNYYRLVSVDLDGSSEEFNVISIDYQPEKALVNVYPNPVTSGENVFIQPNFKWASGSKIEIIDLQGTSIINSSINNASLELSTSQLSAGLYIIRLTTSQGYLTEKLIVQ